MRCSSWLVATCSKVGPSHRAFLQRQEAAIAVGAPPADQIAFPDALDVGVIKPA